MIENVLIAIAVTAIVVYLGRKKIESSIGKLVDRVKGGGGTNDPQ